MLEQIKKLKFWVMLSVVTITEFIAVGLIPPGVWLKLASAGLGIFSFLGYTYDRIKERYSSQLDTIENSDQDTPN